MYKFVVSDFSDDYSQLKWDLCDAVSNTNQILDRENGTLSVQKAKRISGSDLRK